MNSGFTTFEIQKLTHGLILWLNQPQKRNAISSKMVDELNTFFTQVSDETHFVVVAGRGECFAAGADLKEMATVSEETAREISGKLHRLHHNMGNCNALIVAAVHGYAIGGGF